ncbi:expressed unknown protein [Seminavis robusta]|uniref:Uncharacterized protein n=1 Tax=Seminavis robusta TaxID=568900 RepID=A0A9N8HMR6_9STRA|nr:expressed unknown protein [Seminavis robusta]|eukprot:Sro1143_g245940.1 n/a (336) ;mRNA; r:9446-10453
MAPICHLPVLLLWSLSIAIAVATRTPLHANGERDLLTTLEETDQNRHEFLRRLEEGDRHRVRGSFGARCDDDEQNPCFPNLDCTNLGIPLGKRCAPVSCVAKEMELFQQNYDMEAYHATIFAEAGINETEILEESKLGLQEEERSSILSIRERFQTFVAAANQTALMQSMQSHPEPMLAMQGIIQKCTTTPMSRQNTTAKQGDAISYFGVHFEAGVALDASYTQMAESDFSGPDEKQSDEKQDPGQWGRICLGGLHLGANFAIIWGGLYTSDAAAVPCVYWMAEIDIPVLWAPFSFSIGIGANGVSFLEIGPFYGLLGVGLSIGLGGSMCGIFPV